MNLASPKPTIAQVSGEARGKFHLPRAGGDMAGQTGTVHRLCRPAFADYTTVSFPPRGREKVPRLRMLPLEILEPVE